MEDRKNDRQKLYRKTKLLSYKFIKKIIEPVSSFSFKKSVAEAYWMKNVDLYFEDQYNGGSFRRYRIGSTT